jgi:hypothetical protein
MAEIKSRSRVERLLRGDIRIEDITNLFLYLRDRCDGRESVREIGDFVAHHDQRTKGIVTRTTRYWSAHTRFIFSRFTPGSRASPSPIDLKKLPSFTPEFLRASLYRSSHLLIKREAGFGKSEATRLVEKIIARLRRLPSGNFALDQLTTKEFNLIKFFGSFLTVQVAFTGDQLAYDFIAALKSNGLISKAEIRQSSHLEMLSQLFAVSVMHNSTIVDTDGTKLRLEATQDDGDISVHASVPIFNIGEPNEIRVAGAIYSTKLNCKEHCSEQLRSCPNWDTVEIELGANGLLEIMR